MFNNDNPETNGEKKFYNYIKNDIKLIFDVGCRTDTEFLNFNGEVHYFDPVKEFIDNLSKQSNNNNKSFFNDFGLGNEKAEKEYYPSVQSFNARINSLPNNSYEEKLKLKINTGYNYMKEKDIKHINFLKIDTEGYEFDVIKGFKDYINNIDIIQFEYGGVI